MEWFWKLSGIGVLVICISISGLIDRQYSSAAKRQDRLQVACPELERHG